MFQYLLRDFSALQSESPDSPIGELFNPAGGDGKSAILGAAAVRPVLFTLLLVLLVHVRNHDDYTAVVLPHHPPEVFYCIREWSLRGYERSGLVVALEK